MGWWILLWILALLLVILLILLLTNLVLFIDTRHHRYEVRFGRIATAQLVMKENHPGVDLRVFWMHFFLDFFAMGGKDDKKKEKKEKRRKKNRRKVKAGKIFRMIRAVLKSFRIRKLEISMDTESGVWNGLMIPLQYLVHHPQVSIRVNWTGERYLVMHIENTAGRVGWAVMKAFVFGR